MFIHVRPAKSECNTVCYWGRAVPEDSLVGKALRVTRTGPKGCVLSLEGQATLSLTRKGKKADLTAERISVNLLSGHVEGLIGSPPQYQYPPQYQPVTPVAPHSGLTEP